MKAAAWHPSGKGLVLSLQAYLDVSLAKVRMATGKLPAGLIFSNFECIRTMFSSHGHRVSVFQPADAVDTTGCDIARRVRMQASCWTLLAQPKAASGWGQSYRCQPASHTLTRW